jgi:hypothetical protein
MSRPVERILGKDAGTPPRFAVRPFGTSAAEAEAAAAAAAAVPASPALINPDTGEPILGTTVSGTTGGAGGQPNLTTGGALP